MKTSIRPVVFLLFFSSLTAGEFSISTGFEEGSENYEKAKKIVTNAYQSLGHDVTIIKLPGMRSLVATNGGQYDAELYRNKEIESEYSNLIRVNVPLFVEEIYAYALKGTSLDVDGYKFSNLNIGLARSFRGINNKVFGANPGSRIVEVEKLFQLVELLQYKRVDVIVVPKDLFDEELSKNKVEGQIVALQNPLETIELYHYIHRKNGSLLGKLEEAIKAEQIRVLGWAN